KPVYNIGTAAADSLQGHEGRDIILGGAGNDALSGYGGADTLNGGEGADTLFGGAGDDIFVFNSFLDQATNKDTLADFTLTQDKIQLDRDIFTALPEEGTLLSQYFKSSASGVAGDDNDYLLYCTTSGALLYDFDGNGQGVAIEFATLTNKPAIKAEDFLIAS
ncbi:MAG: calcium-binding protein, partial [Pseudomonadota bacterium]